jgi:hypothetical protein
VTSCNIGSLQIPRCDLDHIPVLADFASFGRFWPMMALAAFGAGRQSDQFTDLFDRILSFGR